MRTALAGVLGRGDRARRATRAAARATLRERAAVLAHALSGETVAPEAATDRVLELLARPDDETTWLALSVLTGHLPVTAEVVRARRAAQIGGPQTLLATALEHVRSEPAPRTVEVLTGAVLVDIEHLARTSLGTGIQRVTRETLRRWSDAHELVAVGWHRELTALRPLTPEELEEALGRAPGTSTTSPDGAGDARGEERVVVPWRSTYVLPEVVLELERTQRMESMFRFARSRTAAIGFDTVPLTSAETCAEDVPPRFALELAALRHVDRIATISRAAGTEYAGWRTMVRSMGLPGPDIAAVSLPVDAPRATPSALAEASLRYVVPTLPMVLCVGSHEPRKNHLAVLHAAELLWRDGVQFSLLFVGGNAWKSEGFSRRLAELAAAGRPVESVLGLDDRLLWALYALARCTVFPSVNEGFGLPVAESLASGTPAITSGFGSMLEIAEPGGALTVDPRDDHALAEAMRRALTDDVLYHQLVTEALSRPERGWREYAQETWDYLVATNVDAGPEAV
ncbi:glycosyltransferase family 4 protein [Actinotalea subterranea]|uniref:glycosyltransferase family 4 protein n=1 Tax=Actinotalea subterranea TaxID=2607497 RepID=UPI0011ED3E27|nr:glycosyltransferase family 1 protein [Actinotalea subterranea]